MSMAGGITHARVIKSTDNGATWNPSVVAVNGIDKCWMAADQSAGPYSNYVYAVMTAGGGSGNFARSTNQGASFSQTRVFNTQSLPGMMVAVGPNTIGGDVPGGVVYVVTNSGSAFASTYTFYRSTDGGATFLTSSAQNFANYVGTEVGGRNSVQNMRTRPYPFITSDNSYGPFRGRLYLVYASNNPPGNGNKPDIFLRYSDDQGVTWSTAKTVNDDLNSQNHHQWHPAVWVDKTSGRVFLKWMDTRDTPTSDSAYIYATYSDDGGETFAPNQRISNLGGKMRINCTTCGGGGTPRYQGDYDAIYSLDNISLSMWTDFRFGQFGSYVGYFPDFAMLVSPNIVTLTQSGGEQFVTVEVPDVKLYSDDAIFSASVNPAPANGTITLDFPSGNTISSFPGSIPLRIQTSGNVTLGNYVITVTGNGPNGTPVHKRTVNMEVIIPVELTSFSAVTDKQNVQLNWSTATETNNMGFEIERTGSVTEGGTFGEWENVSFVKGHGTITEARFYSFVDKDVKPGLYSYRLKQIDFDGTFEYSNEIEVEVLAPLSYVLEQNYPNPFNPSTKIEFQIPEQSSVILKIYDVLGNEVRILVNNEMDAGKHSVEFDASELASGIYYYRIQAGEFDNMKKMVLIK
jgi:hypothetical protein